MIVLQNKVNYKFPKTLLRVHYFAQAYDNTVALIFLKQVGQDAFIHCDNQGNILWQLAFGDFVDTLCQINERQFLIMRVENNQIWLLDLPTKQITIFRHQFIFDVSCQCYLDYFCESGLLCVREHGDNDSKEITLTYYQTPLNSQIEPNKESSSFIDPTEQVHEIKPLTVLNRCPDWNPRHIVRKINSRSSYVWCEARHKEQISIFLAHVVYDKVQVLKLKVRVDSLFIKSPELAIVQLWQFRTNELILYTCTNKEKVNEKVVNNSFIWNLDQNKIRQVLFTFDPKYHDLQIDIFGTSKFSMFRTFYFEPNIAKESPAYFIDNKAEKITYQEKWKCSHLFKYCIPDYVNDTIYEGQFENRDVKKMGLRQIKLINKKEMSLFLLGRFAGENEDGYIDISENLANDVIDSLDYQQ